MKIVQPAQIETVTNKDIMAVKIPKELLPMAEDDWNFFIDLKQVKALKIKALDLKTLRLNGKLRHYIYFTGKKEDLITKEGDAEEDKFWDLNIAKNSLKTIKDPNFTTDKLFYYWGDDSLWFPFRGEQPLSPLYYVDYIGGVTNRDYDLDKAEKILKKNPYVSKINRIEIPYYNREATFDTAVEFCVQLPQEQYNKIVEYYKKGEEFWSVRVKECLASAHSLEPFDVLGLKPALKKKSKKQKNQHNSETVDPVYDRSYPEFT